MVLGLTGRRPASLIAIALGLILAELIPGPGRARSPIFDGLPLPQAPYHYCSPPANLKSSNRPPLAGQGSLPLRNGQVVGSIVRTLDGQLIVSTGAGDFRASLEAASVTVRLDPVCEPVPPPPAAVIRGNVYRIMAAEEPNGGPVAVAHPYTVNLMYPPGPLADLGFYDGTSWHPLPTRRASSNSSASADLTGLGEVAAIAPAGGETFLGLLTRLLQGYGFLLFIAFLVTFGVVGEVRSRLRKRRAISRRSE